MTSTSPHSSFPVSVLAILIMAMGFLVRVLGYFANSPLWLDEFFITNNFTELSVGELLQPLKYGQNAPVGWVLIHKALISGFGEGERILRLPSVVASCLSLPLAFLVSRAALGPRLALFPLAVISLSPFVIWQGLQVKQYSTDLFFVLVLLSLSLRDSFHARSRLRERWSLGLMGILSIWFSMPAIFVLAALSGVNLFQDLRQGSKSRFRSTFILAFLWATTFAINYALFLIPKEQPDWLFNYWAPGLLPWPPSLPDLLWPLRVFAMSLSDPLGFLGLGQWLALPLLVGVFILPRVRKERTTWLVGVLQVTVLLTLLAAALGLYPFLVRLVLFLTIPLTVLLVEGVRTVGALLPFAVRGLWVLVLLTLLVPITLTYSWACRGEGLPIASDTRSLVNEIARKTPPQDLLLIDHYLAHGWRYYGRKHDHSPKELPEAWDALSRPKALMEALGEVKQSEVWIALTRVEEESPSSLWGSLQADLSHRDFTLPHLYRWLVDERTEWADLEPIRASLETSWRIEEASQFRGTVLWKAVKRSR